MFHVKHLISRAIQFSRLHSTAAHIKQDALSSVKSPLWKLSWFPSPSIYLKRIQISVNDRYQWATWTGDVVHSTRSVLCWTVLDTRHVLYIVSLYNFSSSTHALRITEISFLLTRFSPCSSCTLFYCHSREFSFASNMRSMAAASAFLATFAPLMSGEFFSVFWVAEVFTKPVYVIFTIKVLDSNHERVIFAWANPWISDRLTRISK